MKRLWLNGELGYTSSPWEARLCALAAVFLIALAFIPGLRSTSDLTWPPYVDFERDASFAQSILEHRYGEDPLYRGETMWFTPMIFSFEAYAAKFSGTPVQVLQARVGPYLNLLAPIAFFIMVWRLFGPSVALSALLAFVYLVPGQEPGWAVATYTPWFLPMCFSQGLFYLMIIALCRAFRTSSWLVWLLTGAGAGLMFLAHAAPTIIVVGMIALQIITSMISSWRAGDRSATRAYLLCAFASGAAFVVVSLPLTWFVVGHYGLDQQNRVPSSFTYPPLALRNAGLFLFHNLSFFNLVAVVGLIFILRSNAPIPRRIMGYWIGMAVFLALFAYTAVVLGGYYGIKLPMSVPAFHFYFYLKGALAIGVGIAMVVSARYAVRLLGPGLNEAVMRKRAIVATTGLTLIVLVACYPTYANRTDLTVVRHRALLRMADTSATDMCHYMRDQLPWESVVLCDDELSMWILMASARKTVATNASMANPYVPPEPRKAARTRMLGGLERPVDGMESDMERYEVTYLLVRTADIPRLSERFRWFPRLVHQNARYALYSRET